VSLLQRFSEGLARRTDRRGLLGRNAEVAFGLLAGAAAGTLARPAATLAGITSCSFPGPPCPCAGCQSNGVCGKPCIIMTQFYASGCWVVSAGNITCCDCDCLGLLQNARVCGCGSDYHNDPSNCP
jgi:hypothetical protein